MRNGRGHSEINSNISCPPPLCETTAKVWKRSGTGTHQCADISDWPHPCGDVLSGMGAALGHLFGDDMIHKHMGAPRLTPPPPWEVQSVEEVWTTFGPNLAPKACGGGYKLTSPSVRMHKMLRNLWGIQIRLQNRKTKRVCGYNLDAMEYTAWHRA